MKIRNMTPHPITLILGDGARVTLPSEGVVRAQAQTTVRGAIHIEGLGQIPLVETTYGPPEGLPEPEPGVLLVVSAIAAMAVKRYYPYRDDVVVVADTVRDENGFIVGARALARV